MIMHLVKIEDKKRFIKWYSVLSDNEHAESTVNCSESGTMTMQDIVSFPETELEDIKQAFSLLDPEPGKYMVEIDIDIEDGETDVMVDDLKMEDVYGIVEKIVNKVDRSTILDDSGLVFQIETSEYENMEKLVTLITKEVEDRYGLSFLSVNSTEWTWREGGWV